MGAAADQQQGSQYEERTATAHDTPVHEQPPPIVRLGAIGLQEAPTRPEIQLARCTGHSGRVRLASFRSWAQDADLDETLASRVDANRASGGKACGRRARHVERVVVEKQHPLCRYGQ